MNKVILLGRLTKDPELRYTTQGTEPLAIVRYSLAVNRKFKREGEADADFINCVAFGKSGEFASKYFKKGQLVCVNGRLQVRSYEKDGQKIWYTDVVIEEQYFAESKSASASSVVQISEPMPQSEPSKNKPASSSEDFFDIDTNLEDDDLPF